MIELAPWAPFSRGAYLKGAVIRVGPYWYNCPLFKIWNFIVLYFLPTLSTWRKTLLNGALIQKWAFIRLFTVFARFPETVSCCSDFYLGTFTKKSKDKQRIIICGWFLVVQNWVPWNWAWKGQNNYFQIFPVEINSYYENMLFLGCFINFPLIGWDPKRNKIC